MNFSYSSPALTLLYVFALLWTLMGVDVKSFSPVKRKVVPFAMVLLCVSNQVLYMLVSSAAYGRLLFLTMHLPTFLLYLYIANRGIIKTAFMILTALVFSAPTMIIANMLNNILAPSPFILLLTNLIVYILMLFLAQFVFRSVFNYLILYGDNRFFLLFSLIPLVYYVYIFAYVNADISSFRTLTGYVIRLLPHLEVFCFYFLLPYIYKSLREKMVMQSIQNALQQKLVSTEDQLALLNETNTQMAVYRHDARHQIILLDGLLSSGNTQQAKELIQTVMTDLDKLTPKRFCENETVNLLCSSYDSKARRLGVQLKINALLPKDLPLSNTELCSVVSNGLENALRAVSQPEVADKWVSFDCHVRQNKLFIQIQNPYAGQVVIHNGIPVSTREGHGYGCRSIQSIAQRSGGLCSFKAENGLFTLRVSIALSD